MIKFGLIYKSMSHSLGALREYPIAPRSTLEGLECSDVEREGGLKGELKFLLVNEEGHVDWPVDCRKCTP